MAQTLTALTALSNPVVKSDGGNLVANMAALDNLGRRDLIVVSILGLVHALYATKDYRTNHPQLIQDGIVLLGGVSNLDNNGESKQVLLELASIDWNYGFKTDPVSSSNTVGLSSDVSTIVKEGRDLRELPEQTLTRIRAMLRYRLQI